MLTRSLIALTLLFVCNGCKNQDQGPPASSPAEAPGTATTEATGDTATGTGTTGDTTTGGTAAGTTGGTGTPGTTTGGTTGTTTGGTMGGATGGTAGGTTGGGTAGQTQGGATPSGTEAVTAVRLVEVDCSQAGHRQKGWTVSAPEGATCQKTADAVLVAAGDTFQLVVREAVADMAARRKAIEGDPARKFRRYTTDTADALVYEMDTGSGRPEYGFFAIKKLDNALVTCEGQKGKGYTQAQAETMVKACQSLTKR